MSSEAIFLYAAGPKDAGPDASVWASTEAPAVDDSPTARALLGMAGIFLVLIVVGVLFGELLFRLIGRGKR